VILRTRSIARAALFAPALVALALAAIAPRAHAVVAVSVDVTLDRRAVNPLVYGVNFGTSAQFAALPYPLRRWGGNATTRYSWTQDARNSGSDWYFITTPSNHPNPALLPHGSEADLFVGETRAAGADVIVTVPTIGWSPKDRVKRWGFSVAQYGAQTGSECTGSGGAWWCQPDAGNGELAGGGFVTGNDPADTSVPIGPSYAGDWVTHLTGAFGTADAGGVRYYALDNETALWNHTHRDVHPDPVTYDELWTRTQDYAAAVKARDAGAKVLGPVVWGWCEYFWSAADGCSNGPDRAAHGGLGLLEWYLAQVEAHRVATGTRLVDYLDIHYYPQAGTALNDDESAPAAAKRLRTVRSLYDAAYVDESWIGQAVRLIPRMRSLIDARCPGTGLAITEYNFGGDTGISSALAQAEALAVFGREGVDLATRWVAPQAGSRCEDAFRMYLNYDGAGARVLGTSVRATSSKPDSVGAYAIEAADGRVQLLLFNKHTTGVTVPVGLGGTAPRELALYRFTAASAWGAAGSATAPAGSVTLALPARSATLAVVSSPTTAAGDPATGSLARLALRFGPNPARAGAAGAIDFTLPRAGRVAIALYDVGGRRLRAWPALECAAGPERVDWDGRDERGLPLPAGNYLLRVSALGQVQTARVVRLP
jgi:hypothetical protein